MRQNSKQNGYTLGELCATLFIVTVVALLIGAFFGPAFVAARDEQRQSSCGSNIKQIGLGLLGYIQDYDETFPPAAQPIKGETDVLSGWAMPHNRVGMAIATDWVLTQNDKGV